MKEKMDKNNLSKGELQHKLFKLVILIIAFIFCCLIGGFIYITLTSTSAKNTTKIIEEKFFTEEAKLNSNEKYHKIISNLDKYYYLYLSNKSFNKNCSSDNFYKIQIYNHIPCISNINITYIINKYLEFISKTIYNKKNGNENFFKIPKLDNKGKLFINNSNKKIKILLAPISQIKYYNSYKKKNDEDNIYNIYLKNNIDERKDTIYYEFILNKSEYLYIPSYYFIQIKEAVDDLLCYKYQDISFFNDIVFQILYN